MCSLGKSAYRGGGSVLRWKELTTTASTPMTAAEQLAIATPHARQCIQRHVGTGWMSGKTNIDQGVAGTGGADDAVGGH